MTKLYCPYCAHKRSIKGFKEENKIYKTECPTCKNKFVCSTKIKYEYESKKADCLNGGLHSDHLWASKVCPSVYNHMECSICGRERDLTTEEIEKYKDILND